MDPIQRKVMKFFLVTNETLNHIKCMVFSRIQMVRLIIKLLSSDIYGQPTSRKIDIFIFFMNNFKRIYFSKILFISSV